MLLTITYEGKNTQDLGFLLYKHPDRAQCFKLNYGKAYVFYPEVSDEKTTAALLLDIDPLDLARGKVGSKEGGLFDYVNDRPYASTSFMSTAIARIFGTAMSGRCDAKPDLADAPLQLTACIHSLKDNGNSDLAIEMFEPLGYQVETRRTKLNDLFPEWGDSPYIDLTIRGKVKLSDLLKHVYVLIPVFDRQKHYYATEEEIQKFLDHGEGWLQDHPNKERLTKRYFGFRKAYARKALDVLLSDEVPEEEVENEGEAENESEEKEAFVPLNARRMEAVKKAVLESGATSVIDLGCGGCRLTSLLLKEPQVKRITACDISVSTLEKAAKRLRVNRMQPYLKDKLTLMQASITYKDQRFEGYDCACLVEVIEHIDTPRIPAVERSIFEFAAPRTVIVTTPNREYNVNYEKLEEGALRHRDHRFEWTRKEFTDWTKHICDQFSYSCVITGIGDVDEKTGEPTQMGVFTKNG